MAEVNQLKVSLTRWRFSMWPLIRRPLTRLWPRDLKERSLFRLQEN